VGGRGGRRRSPRAHAAHHPVRRAGGGRRDPRDRRPPAPQPGLAARPRPGPRHPVQRQRGPPDLPAARPGGHGQRPDPPHRRELRPGHHQRHPRPRHPRRHRAGGPRLLRPGGRVPRVHQLADRDVHAAPDGAAGCLRRPGPAAPPPHAAQRVHHLRRGGAHGGPGEDRVQLAAAARDGPGRPGRRAVSAGRRAGRGLVHGDVGGLLRGDARDHAADGRGPERHLPGQPAVVDEARGHGAPARGRADGAALHRGRGGRVGRGVRPPGAVRARRRRHAGPGGPQPGPHHRRAGRPGRRAHARAAAAGTAPPRRPGADPHRDCAAGVGRLAPPRRRSRHGREPTRRPCG